MLIIIHNEWLYVQKISSKTVWWVMILLFASSLFPYVTAIVSTNFTDSLAQVVYGLVVLFITVSNRGLYRSLYFDTIGKVVGLGLSATIFQPAMLLSVLLTLLVLVIPRQLKED